MLGSLEEIWRRSLDLNLRYYGAVGRLTADYVRDLARAVSEAQRGETLNPTPPSAAGTTKPASETGATTDGAVKQQVGAMVLEGEAGGSALGVFVIENHLKREISTQVVPSSFVASDGHEVKPVMVFDPELITLGPGEQSLVRVVALIDDSLQVEARYAGQFTVPELTGTPIPVVLRRRLNQDVVSVSAVSVSSGKTAGKTGRPNKQTKRAAKKRRSRSTKAKSITS